MKILLALAPLTMILGISCNHNQDYFRVSSGSGNPDGKKW